jgi:hypothetical protein
MSEILVGPAALIVPRLLPNLLNQCLAATEGGTVAREVCAKRVSLKALETLASNCKSRR